MLGMTVVLFVAAEASLRLLFYVIDHRHPSVDYRLTSDTFANSPWIRDYFQEDWEAAKLEWHSYVYWRLKPYRGRYVNVDENGIRRSWQPPEQPAGGEPVEIFVFGGSTTWGNGARDDHTIPSSLARLLHARGINCRVTNFGESGYVSMQELITLMLQLRQGHVPGLVVFYDGVNDTYAAWQRKRAGTPQNERSRVVEFNMSNPKRRAERTRALLREYASSLALRRFTLRVLARVRPVRPPSPAATAAAAAASDSLAQDVVDTYIGHMELVRALADRYGFEYVFFWQPNVFEKEHLTPSEQAQADWMRAEGEFIRKVYEKARRSGMEEKSGGRFHDLSRLFAQTRGPIFFDFCHMGETGNEIVAGSMVDHVARALAAKRP
jgi:lysophospholipase L1-like esterase